MYVYKKKCDEDYYLSIIQATQQQQYMFQSHPNQKYLQSYPQQLYNNSYPSTNNYTNPYNNYYSNNFYNNNYNPYRTPESKNYSQLFNNNDKHDNQFNINSISPSPILNRNDKIYGYNINGNRKHIMEDQILYNKLNSINEINNNKTNRYANGFNNEYFKQNIYAQNNNNNNKKIFKLEDFLSDYKKTNLNDKFNRAENDIFY